MDWVTKERVQKLLDTRFKDREFTTQDVLALLPKDRHLPTSCELGSWLRCIACSTDKTHTHEKVTIWVV